MPGQSNEIKILMSRKIQENEHCFNCGISLSNQVSAGAGQYSGN